MKKVLLTICLVSIALFAAEAQNKLGHINTQELISSMPEYISAIDDIKSYENGIMASLNAMAGEFEQKKLELEQNGANMSAFDVEIKTNELQSMFQRIQGSENDAQQKVIAKSQEVMLPIEEKIINAINDLGKEGSFTYIFDTYTGKILYADESENILPLVKAKLGL